MMPRIEIRRYLEYATPWWDDPLNDEGAETMANDIEHEVWWAQEMLEQTAEEWADCVWTISNVFYSVEIYLNAVLERL